MSQANYYEVHKSTDNTNWAAVALIADPTVEYNHENKSNSGITQYFKVRAAILGIPQTNLPMYSAFTAVSNIVCTYDATNEDQGFEIAKSINGGGSYTLATRTDDNATSGLVTDVTQGLEHLIKVRAVRDYPPQAALPMLSAYTTAQAITCDLNIGKLAGKAGSVTIGGSPVLGMSSWSIDYKFGVEDVTDYDSSGTAEFIQTISSWSGSFDGFKDGAPIGGGAIVAGIFKESQTSTQKWTGNVIITGVSPNTPVEGIVSYKYTFQGTAALTVPTT